MQHNDGKNKYDSLIDFTYFVVYMAVTSFLLTSPVVGMTVPW
jgi:hypothetical protein